MAVDDIGISTEGLEEEISNGDENKAEQAKNGVGSY
jgi:hypothetical protein